MELGLNSMLQAHPSFLLTLASSNNNNHDNSGDVVSIESSQAATVSQAAVV
jgi:hypothetical protein